MNEGWATFWHSKIMTEKALKDNEVIDYALSHSGTVATSPGRINPYKIGLELFRYIKERWDKGKFGREFEACDDIQVRSNWDKHLGQGLPKIFDVRKIYNDIMFIDEFITEEFCNEQKLFIYQLDQKTGHYIIKDRDYRKVKEKILFSLTNMGNPIIIIRDGNYEKRGILYLYHKHIGADLKLDKTKDTMRALHKIWKHPVYLETKIQDKGLLLTFDGHDHREHAITYSER
jgi:stage V sporulation protein R